jgi:hypothetical protein
MRARNVVLWLVISSALAVGLVGWAGGVAGASSPPLHLAFDKTLASTDPLTWTGTVTGDIEGDLTTVLLAIEEAGPVGLVEFDWIVDAGPLSFTARLTGILNNETGGVEMDGTVVKGYLAGAQVHEKGQLVDPATLRFQGSIQIMPATAG